MKFVFWIAASVLYLAGAVTGFFNLYMDENESTKVLGLNVELYYVKEGKLNDYALHFVVPVPSNISQLAFTWQALGGHKLPYRIHILSNLWDPIHPPRLNISKQGVIPSSKQVFTITLACTGILTAELDIQIIIDVIVSPTNTTVVTINRKKICIHDENAYNEVHEPHDNYVDHPVTDVRNSSNVMMDAATVLIQDRNPIIVAIGGATAVMIVVLMLFSTVCYVQSKKIRTTTTPPQLSHSGTKYMEWPASQTTLKSVSHGYVTSAITPEPGQKIIRVGSPVASTVASYSSFRKATPIAPSRALLCSNAFLAASANDCSDSLVSAANNAAILSEQIQELGIRRDMIRFDRILQQGTYGRVYHGMMFNIDGQESEEQPVYIKCIKEYATAEQVSNFLNDGLRLHGMHHTNVLPVIGVCIETSTQPILVYPYTSEGNLKCFLNQSHCSAKTGESSPSISTQDLVDMAIQIVKGICFLHHRHFLHKDIATRNCVVDERLNVKIADNALARDLFPNDYVCLGDGEARPVRWMAPESLTLKEFTPAADLWQYGVLFWELMTLGQQPYAEINPYDQVDHLRSGWRLQQPRNCPNQLYEVMLSCWRDSPSDRLTCNQLLGILPNFYNELGSFI